MDDIDPTPIYFFGSRTNNPKAMPDIDPTPRRRPESRTSGPQALQDIDPTPRRLPATQNGDPRPDSPAATAPLAPLPEPEPAQNSPKRPRVARRHGPPMVGPGRRNGCIPLSPLPELKSLVPHLSARVRDTRPTIPLKPLENTTAISHQSQSLLYLGTERAEAATATHKLPMEQPEPLIIAPKRPTRKRQRRLIRAWTIFLLLLLLPVGGIAYGFYFVETNILGPLAQFFHPLKGDNDSAISGRTWNLLLLGSDNDDKFVYPNLLTQVMMIVHIDPINNSVYMLSIPRDSWVHVPDRAGMHKIDQAFYLGSAPHHSFDDGVRMARATIKEDYGIPIDRYAWIGLDGFSRVINTLGGLDMDLEHPILDDDYPDDIGSSARHPYAIKRLLLAPGPQHLDGSEALEYVRSRHADLVGDIGRIQRQQAILKALKHKLNLPTIFNRLGDILKDLHNKIYTDLSQNELISFANFSRNLAPEAIQRLALGPGHGSQDYGSLSQITDPGLGETQDIVLPNCANIQPEINMIFGLGNTQSCRVNGP